MGISMFSAQYSPIAIDFGSSAVKLLQIGAGERPVLLSAAELAVSDSMARSQPELMGYLGGELPKLIRAGGFRGKKAVCSIPCGQTFIQHMQIGEAEGVSHDDLVKAQLQTQVGCSPDSVEVRRVEVTEVHRGGLARTETICFAIARDAVMRYVDLLNKCKLDVVGVHTEVQAMVRAFDHIHHGPDDETTTTLFVDMGYGGTKVAITHGRRLTFARCIQLGGRTFDALIAEKLHCDMGSAKAHRISLGSALKRRWPEPSETGSAIVRAGAAHAAAGARSASGAGTAAATVEPRAAKPSTRRGTGKSAPLGDAVDVDFTELIESLSDEVSMCLRYHQSLFPGRSIDRMVFVGGESRHTSMCRDIARVLELAAQLGDPLSRLGGIGSARAIGLTLGQPQPGWAVAYGLCASPSDE